MTNVSDENVYDTIIIGAGISGISAFYYLNKLNKDKKILMIEKEKQVGGNVRAFKYQDTYNDYGSLEIFNNYYIFNDIIKNYPHEYMINGKLDKQVSNQNISLTDYLNLFSAMMKYGYMSYYDVQCLNDNKSCNLFRKGSYWNDYMYSYTYADCSDILECILYPGILKNRCNLSEKIVKNSLQVLLTDIVNDILTSKENINKLVLETSVVSIESTNDYNIIKTALSEYKATNVIMTSPVNELYYKLLGMNYKKDIYTHYYIVIIENITDLNYPWNVYLESKPEIDPELYITTYGRISNYKKVMYIFIRSKSIIRKDDEYITDFMKKTIKFVTDYKILVIDFFEHCMPSIDYPILDTINKNQGKNNIWFAGQYLGFPSMETASYTGYKAATKVSKKDEIELENKINSIDTISRNNLQLLLACIIISMILCILVIIIVVILAIRAIPK